MNGTQGRKTRSDHWRIHLDKYPKLGERIVSCHETSQQTESLEVETRANMQDTD